MIRRVCALISLLLLAVVAQAEEIRIAVAANFSEPMKRIAGDFENASGHKLLLSFGATGKFYAQIKAGAPFQILLAADEATPRKLENEGAAVAGSRFTYAIGKLVLWSANDACVDAGGEVLKRGGFDHIAIANPKLAPYGVAAVEAMRALGVYDKLAARLVQGENIAQTWQFIATGNATLGFVALSQVIATEGEMRGQPGSGSMWVVPENLYSPIRQDAVLLDRGKDSAAARALLGYLKSKAARDTIRAFGYGLPS